MTRFAMRSIPEADSYRKRGAWIGTTVADDARRLVEAGLTRDVFLGDSQPSSVGDIVAEAQGLLAALQALGLRAGDVLSFMLPNWREAAAINLAAALGNFVINPIVPIYREAETSFILSDCSSRLIFIPTVFRRFDYSQMLERIRPKLPDLRHVVTVRGDAPGSLRYDVLLAEARGSQPYLTRVDPASLKLIMYTSGTTGTPKAVLHSHETLARAVAASAEHWQIGLDDVVLMPSPITHVSGYSNGIERPFLGGTRTVLMEDWNADEAVRLIDLYGATMTVAATPFLQELVTAAERAGSRLPTMRCFACGGASVSSSLVQRANEVFAHPCAFRVYGSSEAPFVTLGFTGAENRKLAADTDGEVVDYEVQIVDEQGQLLPPGVDGEILVKGPALFMGYADSSQTAESFTPGGFFRTGDIGRLVDNGALVITDRKKDLIIRGGENISAREIEDALHRHPGILHAAAVSMPHSRLGECVCAFIIARSSTVPTVENIRQFLGEMGLARQKAPERIEAVDSFPRTASGKIRKDILRSRITSIVRNEERERPKLS